MNDRAWTCNFDPTSDHFQFARLPLHALSANALFARKCKNVFSILVKLAIDYNIRAKKIREMVKIKSTEIIFAKYQKRV